MDKMDIDELENKKLFFQDNDQIEGISPKQEDSELLLEEELRKGFVSPQFVEKDPEEFKKSLQKELENGGEKIEQQETDHKKQVELLKETNWATKYHLIYSKINCAIERILCIIQTKNKFILQRRFEKYRQIASMPRRMQACQAKFIINNLQGSVKKLMQFYSSRVLKVKLHYYLKLWVGQLRKMKGIEELKKRSKEIQDKFKLEFTKQTKKFENLEEKLQLCALESTQLRENERNLRGLLKEREEKERVLKDAIERLKKRDEEDRKLPRSVQDRIQVVESHILDLEAQNRELKDRLGLNETTVGGFVQDMNECLDCIEFTKLEDFDLNELRELDNEKKQERGAGGTQRKNQSHPEGKFQKHKLEKFQTLISINFN